MIHETSRVAKRHLPSFLFSAIRKIGTAVLTPVSFSYHSGHFLSSLKGKALDRRGHGLVWYTYPAINFLENKDFTGKTILEFGAGQSTLWWSKRANQVISFENDEAWGQYIHSHIPSNVSLNIVDYNNHDNIYPYLDKDKYDVIIIDGIDRIGCSKISLKLLAEDGLIILDNSDAFGNEIIDLFREAKFSRIDFYGYVPGIITKNCTSLFFRGESFIFKNCDYPLKLK